MSICVAFVLDNPKFRSYLCQEQKLAQILHHFISIRLQVGAGNTFIRFDSVMRANASIALVSVCSQHLYGLNCGAVLLSSLKKLTI